MWTDVSLSNIDENKFVFCHPHFTIPNDDSWNALYKESIKNRQKASKEPITDTV